MGLLSVIQIWLLLINTCASFSHNAILSKVHPSFSLPSSALQEETAALAGVAQLAGGHPTNGKVASLNPSQAHAWDAGLIPGRVAFRHE